MENNKTAPSHPARRIALSLAVPLVGAVILASAIAGLLGGPSAAVENWASRSLLLGSLGLISWLLGLRWYGLAELGLRGGRPLYAGIGFASLGWIVFLVARLFLVSSRQDVLVSPDFGRVFIYLLLFEAFAVQLWAFGLLFRGLAEWRGPLTAAVTSGILFGAVASQLFEEAYLDTVTTFLYFIAWGVFYGLIRLRTGSILGIVVIQAMHSLTAWHILLPETQPLRSELHNLYLIAAVFYMIFIWRLWPNEEEDYRV
jgi:hypothetical protein